MLHSTWDKTALNSPFRPWTVAMTAHFLFPSSSWPLHQHPEKHNNQLLIIGQELITGSAQVQYWASYSVSETELFLKWYMDTTSTTGRTSSETSRFCNHLSIIQSHKLAKRVLIILELNWNQRFRGKKTNWTFVIICSRRPHNSKTGHFASWKDRERLRNVQKWKMHVQSVQNYCFLLSNMQICDVLVAVVVVVA